MTNLHFQNEPEVNASDTPNLFEASTMNSAEDSMPYLTEHSIYDNWADSFDRQLPLESPTDSNTTRSTSAESEEHPSNNQFCIPSSAPSTFTQTLASLPTCECLEQHSRLLCQLEKLKRPQHTALTLDVMLIAVQDSVETWHNLIRCRVCSCDDDQTVLLFSVMTMRSMLRCFQRLCPPSGEKDLPSDISSLHLGVMRLGSYEVTNHEQALVTSVLIIHGLGKIKHAVLSLKDKLFHSRGRTADANLTNEHRQSLSNPQIDVEDLRQLLQNLDGTIQVVRNATAKKGYLALGDFGNSPES